MKKTTFVVEEKRAHPLDKSSHRTIIATVETDSGFDYEENELISEVVFAELEVWEETILEDHRLRVAIESIEFLMKGIRDSYGTAYYPTLKARINEALDKLPELTQQRYLDSIVRLEEGLEKGLEREKEEDEV